MANFDDLFTAPTATETQSDRPQLTKEEYAAKKKAERDSLYALADEMAQEVMRDGEAFRGFLDVQARFDRYSATNALLIYAQNDEATRLRDFDGWKERGIYVRKNETGISILEAGDSYVTEDGRTGYYYNVKKVFDISQTDAKRQRQPQVHYDDRLLLSALIAKRPVPIEMADSVQNGAVYDYERKTIFVQRGMDGQDLFRSVSLALARAEMAQQENSTPQADAFKSYCVSYMLCRKYGVDTQGYVFIMLGLYAGLRREEILGLQWDSVYLDTEAPYLTVRRAWHTEHNRPVISTELKTAAAERNIPLPDHLAACLREAKKKSTSDFVVANRDGDPLSYTQFKRLWQYVVTRTAKPRIARKQVDGKYVKYMLYPELGEKARNNGHVVYSLDFEVTPHLLRHTYITNLIHASVDPKTVQYLAGHENSRITMDIYAKVKYNRPDDVVKAMTSAFAEWDAS